MARSGPLVKAAQAAMRAAGSLDATRTATLTRSTSSYDAATGKTTATTQTYTWSVVVSEYADGLVDGASIVSGDRRVLGAAGDLAVVPSAETDSLTVEAVKYQIVRVKTDPTEATWELQVRR